MKSFYFSVIVKKHYTCCRRVGSLIYVEVNFSSTCGRYFIFLGKLSSLCVFYYL